MTRVLGLRPWRFRELVGRVLPRGWRGALPALMIALALAVACGPVLSPSALAQSQSQPPAHQQSASGQEAPANGTEKESVRDVAEMAERFNAMLGPASELIKLASLVVGLMVFISGALRYRQRVEMPTAVPLMQPAIRLAVGALLIGLPFFMGVTVDTLFGRGSKKSSDPSAVVPASPGAPAARPGQKVIYVPAP